jgi:hypothetical protein
LSLIGYEISLKGEKIRLRYQKQGSPPESVRVLIDELSKCKADAVKILKTGNSVTPMEKSQPPAHAKDSWPVEVQAFLNRFSTLEPPQEPFYLEPHQRVIDPEKFFSSLRLEIEAGPEGPRGKYGALIDDLMALKKILH